MPAAAAAKSRPAPRSKPSAPKIAPSRPKASASKAKSTASKAPVTRTKASAETQRASRQVAASDINAQKAAEKAQNPSPAIPKARVASGIPATSNDGYAKAPAANSNTEVATSNDGYTNAASTATADQGYAKAPTSEAATSNDGYTNAASTATADEGYTNASSTATADEGYAPVADAKTTSDSGAADNASAENAAVTARSENNVYTAADPKVAESIKSGGAGELVKGHKGPAIKETQAALSKQGFSVKADGLMGPKTEAAVKGFQEKSGLPATGRLDAATNKALHTAPAASVNETQAKEAVKEAQATEAVEKGAEANAKNLTATFDKVSKVGQRNQMVQGKITVNGNTYNFNSGGGGRGNLPAGTYKVTKHLNSRSNRSMSQGGVGYSFAMSDKYDKRVGDTRSLLRIHPDGGRAGTIGCIGIVGGGNVQRQFRADMNAEIERNGGSVNLDVG